MLVQVFSLRFDPVLGGFDDAEVREFDPRVVAEAKSAEPGPDPVYLVLGRRFESGQAAVAGGHDEHQP